MLMYATTCGCRDEESNPALRVLRHIASTARLLPLPYNIRHQSFTAMTHFNILSRRNVRNGIRIIRNRESSQRYAFRFQVV